MGFTVNFMANKDVTAEELNNAGYNLTNTVYTTFEDDTLYGVDDLNQITGNIISKGVKRNAGNECSVTMSDGTVHIADGTAFFDCGAVIKIDKDGIDIEPETSESTQYVYLFFNKALNVAGARCTTAAPSGDYVLLGTVSGGTIAMDRTFASFQPDVKGTNEVKVVALNYTQIGTGYDLICRYKTDFNVTKYSKVYFHHKPRETTDYTYKDNNNTRGVFDIKNQVLEFCVCSRYSKYSYNWFGYIYGENNSIARIEDGYLIIDLPRDYGISANNPLYLEFYGGAED